MSTISSNYFLVIIGVTLCISPILSRAADYSFYRELCSQIAQDKHSIYAYKNNNNEYLINVHLLGVYKHFKGCKARDENVKINSSFDSQIQEIEQEIKKIENLDAETLSRLNLRMFNIFNQIKNLHIDYLNRISVKNSDPKKRHILEDLKTRISKIRLSKSKYCNSYNTSYNPINHSISICDETLFFPESTLAVILAHELAHALDPCMLQFTLSHVDNENPFASKNSVSDISELKDGYTTIPFEWAKLDFFVEREHFKTSAAPTEYSKNPFRTVTKCLQSPQSVHAEPRKNTIANSIVTDEERMCNSAFDDGQMQEAFADWLGYEIFALFLESKPQAKQAQLIKEGTLNITTNECADLESDFEIQMRSAILNSEKCKADNAAYFQLVDQLRSQKLKDNHPGGQLRIDRLFYAQPYLQSLSSKYLNAVTAESNKLKYCMPN
jgi:hypothetical protein